MTSQALNPPATLPVLVIENDPEDPVGRLGDWLEDAGLTLEVRSAAAGEALPDSLSGFSGLIVMGGGQDAGSDRDGPWFPDLRSLLAAAVRDRLPTLGVCLGAQLLAQATGGRVERSEWPEYGSQLIAKRQAAAADVLFKELPITPDVLQWHRDEVSRLPAGAVLLASSPTTEVQAFRVGPRAWGLQFHIETTPAMIEAWARADSATEDGAPAALADYDVPAIVARSIAAHPDLAEVWQPFAERFAAVVGDPSLAAEPRGLPMAGGAVSTAGPITDPAAIRAALAAELQASREPHRH
jgi:GMP synthase (glutamine-hydrolysing)